ncbi:MAG: hypothetical protein MJE63_00800 [Proteobacteria bacterium]|nr:hypothetical protein [Pseudomonadota bacterium]
MKPNTKDPRNRVNANFECEAWPLNADSKPAPGEFKTTIASRYQAPAEITKEEVEGTGKATESRYEGDVEESTSKKKKS